MKLLLDQGLPRSAALLLRQAGIDTVHASECDLATAADLSILEFARRHERIVVTLDADFHALLALSGAREPSVIRLRVAGVRATELVQLLRAVLDRCGADVAAGAMVSVTETQIRVRNLPI